MRIARSQARSCLFLGMLVCGLGPRSNAPGVEPTPQTAETLRRFEFVEAHMGTRFRIVLYAPDASSASTASNSAFDRIRELDHIMSDYQPDSELMQLCLEAGRAPVKISEDLFRVLTAAEDLSKRSGGAFDVTVGPLVGLWRRARRRREMPDPERLARALKLVGYRNVRLDPRTRTAQLLKSGMLLDLGAIAKGYAADEGLRVLKRHGLERALVAAAGDIAVGKPPPGRKGWRVMVAPLGSPDSPASRSQIQNPKSKKEGGEIRFVLLHDAGISTSGDAEQHVEIAGTRYSHIVNPQTGMALTGRSSVTVIAPNDTTADSLATAVSVLGPRRGLELVDATPGVRALIVEATAEGIRSFEVRFPATLSRSAGS
jgi:FAD:protein FMN transferase